MIARCPARSLSGTLVVMSEWTPEAVKAEIEYRRGTAACNWQRSNGRAPSWIRRVIHRTSGKLGGVGA